MLNHNARYCNNQQIQNVKNLNIIVSDDSHLEYFTFYVLFKKNVVSLNNYHYDQILIFFFNQLFVCFLWYQYFLLFLYSNPFMVLPVKIEKATCLSTCLSHVCKEL